MADNLLYQVSALQQQVRNMVKRGSIHSVQAAPPRCRVTFGKDPVNGDEHVSDWLLWWAASDSEKTTWNMPAVGAPVIVFSEGGVLKNGIVYPLGITDNQTAAGSTATEHVTKYSDGASVSYDTSTHAAAVSLPDGGTASVKAPGGITLDGPVTITETLTVEKTAEVKGDLSSGGNINATGDISDQGDTSSSMAKIRETYNEHDHQENGDGGGTTNPPNQKF